MAVYLTLLKPGDTVLGMNLAHGGHLTHGHPLNFSGKLYTIVPYGVRKDDERIDYDELDRLADEHKPKMIIVGASAYPRVIDFARIRAPPIASARRCSPTWRTSPGSSRPASIRARCRTPTSSRRPRTRRCADRAAAWCSAASKYAKDLDRTVFPGVQGGPLMHIIAAKAVCFKEAAEPAFADVPAPDRRERRAARRRADDAGFRPRQRRHRQSPDARRRVLEGHHRQGRGGGARQGRHHGQQERHPVRSESADGRERHPHRHAGRDDARHARSRDGAHRPSSSRAR